ncbi:MAG: insulinase family protein [Sedimentisphaerales bacterium]|nr:insulinase family protein [Sedimentisphaerales bacterium]
MESKTDKCVLPSGMVLLGEPMEGVESVAFDFMLPAGAAVMPEGTCGAANVASDWIFRGAGPRDNRALGDALDGLGLHRSDSVGSSHLSVGAALESSNLAEALALHADVILRPHLKDEEFEPAKQLALEGVLALDDEPRQRVMVELRKRFYPSPLGRSTSGEIAELKRLTTARTRAVIKDTFDPAQTIFTIAGKYDFDAVREQMEQAFGACPAGTPRSIPTTPRAGKYTHIPNDGAQVHIGLMTETVRFADDDYYDIRVATSILSGGMSARLFTEVREKRGLCYAVGARYHSLKDAAGIMCYAGTAPEKAQETLDVIVAEFRRLAEGITAEELERAKIGLKSSLIMQSESSSSRAGAIGSDYYMLGRVRSLEEVKQRIERTTVDSVLACLRNHPFEEFTVVTIGPTEVRVG